ncbi:unnamed protein product, partial [Meganyctiphanes norvegica]
MICRNLLYFVMDKGKTPSVGLLVNGSVKIEKQNKGFNDISGTLNYRKNSGICGKNNACSRVNDKSDGSCDLLTQNEININLTDVSSNGHTQGSPKPFKCSECDFKCGRKGFLIKHKKTHSRKQDFKCIECEYKTKAKTTLSRHMMTHSGEKPFKCSECDYRSSEVSTLKNHMLRHAGERPFACDVCSYTCIQKQQLQCHIKTHATSDEKKFTCSECDYKTHEMFILKGHMKKHSDDKPFSCSECEYICKRAGDLKKHMSRRHVIPLSESVDEKPFECTECEYRTKTKSQLNRHMLNHSDQKRFSCHLCDYKCAERFKLKNHVKRIHADDKPFACPHCSYRSFENSKLKTHIMTHTGKKPFACDECEYKSTRKQELNMHMLTHTGNLPFICSYCGYRCLRNGDLKRHMLIHTNQEKTFECTDCNYKTFRKSKLKIHMRTHTKEKPYSCTMCDYRCNHDHSLKKHLLTHGLSSENVNLIIKAKTAELKTSQEPENLDECTKLPNVSNNSVTKERSLEQNPISSNEINLPSNINEPASTSTLDSVNKTDSGKNCTSNHYVQKHIQKSPEEKNVAYTNNHTSSLSQSMPEKSKSFHIDDTQFKYSGFQADNQHSISFKSSEQPINYLSKTLSSKIHSNHNLSNSSHHTPNSTKLNTQSSIYRQIPLPSVAVSSHEAHHQQTVLSDSTDLKQAVGDLRHLKSQFHCKGYTGNYNQEHVRTHPSLISNRSTASHLQNITPTNPLPQNQDQSIAWLSLNLNYNVPLK